MTQHVPFWDIRSCLARIWCVRLTVASLSVRSFSSTPWQRMGKVRLELRDCNCITTVHMSRMEVPDCPLRHNRKMSLTWHLMSHFSGRHTSCCYKLFKQLLRNSTFAGSAETSLWPWTWYVAIVGVISQVTRSIWCYNEAGLESRFDSLPSCCCFDIWVPHSGRVVVWKGRRRWQVFDGHGGYEMLISLWEGCLRVLRVNSHERDRLPPCAVGGNDLALAGFVSMKKLSWRQVGVGMAIIW